MRLKGHIMTSEELMKKIEKLEERIGMLEEEVAYLKSKKSTGRKVHNEEWRASYDDFVCKLESGMEMVEIIEKSPISRSTAYRYKAYYEKLKRDKN